MKQVFVSIKYAFVAALFVLASCSKDDDGILVPEEVKGPYSNGLIVVNEGWFGHESGSLNFLADGTAEVKTKVFAAENPGKELGTTTEFAAKWKGKIYVVSKIGDLVVINAATLKEEGRISTFPDNVQPHAFCGITADLGVLSTSNGTYKVNLNTLTVGDKLAGVEGATGEMIVAENRLFVISRDNGVVAYNAATLAFEKTLTKGVVGFAKTLNGKIWTANEDTLKAINPKTLELELVPTKGVKFYYPSMAWTPSPIAASGTDNTVYFAKAGSWGGGTDIYRYVTGDASSVTAAFAKLPAGYGFYGCALRVDPKTKQVVAIGVKDGWGENYQYNKLVFYNGTTGATDKTVDYTGYFFPAMLLFN